MFVIYHHNYHHHHHAAASWPIPVSMQQSTSLCHGQAGFLFSCSWYFVTACISLDPHILWTGCVTLMFFKFFYIVVNSFVVKQYFVDFLRNAAVMLDLSCSFSVQVSLTYSRMAAADVRYICSLVCFYTFQSFITWLIILTICQNFVNLFVTSSDSHDSVHPK